MSQAHCIVVGGGYAAAQVVASLVAQSWDGRITLVSQEQSLPYHRPPLSKAFLAGQQSVEDLLIRGSSFYEKPGIQVLLNTQVQDISRSDKTIGLGNGRRLSYDKLVITTGARVRRAPWPGNDLNGVFYLRDLTDAQQIIANMPKTRQAVVVGGGFIGLEAASSLRKVGIEVTILESQSRLLQRVTDKAVSDFFMRLHQEEGVRILTGVSVRSIDGTEGQVQSLTLDTGDTLSAQMVIVGIGVQAETDLACTAGLVVDNGICVDPYGQTSDPDILAAGDCTMHYNPIYERMLRLESVQNATDQAKVVAETLCGKLRPYHTLPWFWSDQYDVKLQIAGLSQGHDRVVLRGSQQADRSFAVFYFQGQRLLAIDAINRPKEFIAVRKALTEGSIVDPEKLADESLPLSAAFSATPVNTLGV